MNVPQVGEIWEINMWSPLSGGNKFPVLVLEPLTTFCAQSRATCSDDTNSEEDRMFLCLEGKKKRELPMWMFSNAILISGRNITC